MQFAYVPAFLIDPPFALSADSFSDYNDAMTDGALLMRPDKLWGGDDNVGNFRYIALVVGVATLGATHKLWLDNAFAATPPLFTLQELGSIGDYDPYTSQDKLFRINDAGLVIGTSVNGVASTGPNDFQAIYSPPDGAGAYPTAMISLPEIQIPATTTTPITYESSTTKTSGANGLNAAGLVAGWIGAVPYSRNTRIATIWTRDSIGNWTFVSLPLGTYASSAAFDINDSNEVVGTVTNSAGITYAAYWPSATATPVVLNYSATQGGIAQLLIGEAYSINNLGQIVGVLGGYGTQGNLLIGGSFASERPGTNVVAYPLGSINTLRNNGALKDPTHTGWGAAEINNLGIATGSSIALYVNQYKGAGGFGQDWDVSQPYAQSIVGTIQDILSDIFPIKTHPAYGDMSWATAINDSNHVLLAAIRTSTHSTTTSVPFAFESVSFLARQEPTATNPNLWVQYTLHDQTVNLPVGFSLVRSTGISNNDRIVGIAGANMVGIYSGIGGTNGDYRAFVLTPAVANVTTAVPIVTAATTTPVVMAAKRAARAVQNGSLDVNQPAIETLAINNMGPIVATEVTLNVTISPIVDITSDCPKRSTSANSVTCSFVITSLGVNQPVAQDVSFQTPDAQKFVITANVDTASDVLDKFNNAKSSTIKINGSTAPDDPLPPSSPSDTPPATNDTQTSDSSKSGGCTLGDGHQVDSSLPILLLLAMG